MKECKSCGRTYPDSENFCMECGGELSTVERPAPELPEVGGRVEGLERGLNELNDKIESLRSKIPVKDIDILKTMTEETSKKVKDINALKTASEETAKRIDEIDSKIEKFLKGIKGSKTRITELEKKQDLLLENIDQGINSKLEAFKVNFNNKLNKLILNLRNEVNEKTAITEKIRNSLVEQMRIKRKRDLEFENRMKQEIASIENFKEGLNLQQQQKLKGVETGLTEKLGEITIDLEGKIGKRISGLENKLKAIDSLKKEFERRVVDIENFKKNLEEESETKFSNLEKLGEDLIIHQQSRLVSLGSELKKGLDLLKEQGDKLRQDLLKQTQSRLVDIENKINRNTKRLNNLEKSSKTIKKVLASLAKV